MKRRDFLKYSSLLGFGGMVPLASSLNLYAAQDDYTGPLWLSIDARGGWDPTSFCDPKGYITSDDPKRINNYAAANIIKIANSPFEVAPMPEGTAVIDTGYTTKMFFEKFTDDLLVINGIDYQTNGHADGTRHIWGGELARQGYPNFAALIAAELAGQKAMPFMANGGYNFSAGLTTPVRINNDTQKSNKKLSDSLTAMLEIAYPGHSQNASDIENPITNYYSPEVTNLIKASQQERLTQLQASQKLPRIRAAIEQFRAAGQSGAGMTDFADFFANGKYPGKTRADFETATTPAGEGRLNAYRLYRQGRTALAGYATGVTAAAHISLVGFDTHSNHDINHHQRLMDYLQAVDAIIDDANTMGLGDKLVITMGSDFGRTNFYNNGNQKDAQKNIIESSRGKDHWPISSMMFIAKGRIAGNRVVGATDSQFKALKIDPTTLDVDTDKSNLDAVRITPAHIHRSLRRLAGVDITDANNTAAKKFPLKGKFINLFGQ